MSRFDDDRPRQAAEPSRRCFFAMQLPSSSSAHHLHQVQTSAPTRRFSAIELDAGELAHRLLLLEQSMMAGAGCFGDRRRCPLKRRSCDTSIFEVVDLGPVSGDKGSTRSLGPAAVHRVSVRRKKPSPCSARSSTKSRRSDRLPPLPPPREALPPAPRARRTLLSLLLPCCATTSAAAANDDDDDDDMTTSATTAAPFLPARQQRGLFRKTRRRITQFFENIAPCEGFANDDALEEYLYDRSKQILPEKDCKPAHDSKPRHPPEVLKSPGIKQPKSNHYSKGHPKTSFHSANVIPLTPSPRDDNHRSPSFASKHSEDFGLVGITPGQTPQYLGDVSRRVPGPATTSFPLGPVPKKAPPPLHPRRSRTSANGPSASVKSPSSPSPYPKQLKSPMLNLHAQAFIFPDPVAPPPPPPAQRAMKPPAPLPGVATVCSLPRSETLLQTSEHRVTLPSIGASEPAADGDSPSVSVSLPPPSLPPRMRPGSANAPAPPPRPPKPSHLTPPKHQAPVPPPPLPPKTYKTRRQSSSPTN